MDTPAENPHLDGEAWAYAQRYLTSQPRTTGQVRRKLKQRHFSPPVIETVLAELAEAGFLDDRAYAIEFVRTTTEHRPMGRVMLKVRLIKRLLPATLIDEVLTEHFDAKIERAAVARAFERKVSSLSPDLSPQKRKEKLGRYLASRGFPAGPIWDMLGANEHEEQAASVSRDKKKG